LELIVKDIEHLIHHSATENVLVDLAVGSTKRLALVQEVQHHPLTQKVLHVDLHEVKEDEKVTIMVPVESTGEAVGVKTGGGTLEHVLFKLKVRALPKDLPEVIMVDVSALEIGTSIHIGDLQAPTGVEILGDKKITVLSVAAPLTEAAEAAATEAVAGAAAQPEMIKEKKEDGAAPAKDAKGGDKAAADKGGEKKAAEKKK
jgi:large subunit ribosomal protein L25